MRRSSQNFSLYCRHAAPRFMASADPRAAFLTQLNRDVEALQANYQGLVLNAGIPTNTGEAGAGEHAEADAPDDSVRRQAVDLRLHQEKIIFSAQSLLRLVGQLRYSRALHEAREEDS